MSAFIYGLCIGAVIALLLSLALASWINRGGSAK